MPCATKQAPLLAQWGGRFGMKTGYRISPLPLGADLQAYCLVQMATPDFPTNDWAEIAGKTSRWTILSLEDAAGYIRGLVVYRVAQHATAGELLDVPIFLAASTIDDDTIAEIMFTMLRKRSAGCDYMRVWTDQPRDLAEMEDENKFSRWDHGLMVRVDQKPRPALL